MRTGSELFFETGEVFGIIYVVVGLAFVYGEAECVGLLDRFAVDGVRGPRYVEEEPFV